ncbi:hypothetical protein [Micromonospora sp. I033]
MTSTLDPDEHARLTAEFEARKPILPWSLTWVEVDPERHPFDPATAPDVIRSLPPADAVPAPAERTALRYEAGDEWADAMSFAILHRYGRWATGWRYNVGEGDIGGGPVGAWCCPRHSITTPEATLTVVADALREWRAYLEDLTERFGRFLPLVTDPAQPGDTVLDAWERAVANLVTVVVDRTGAESGWEHHCRQVLGWFLTAAGVPAARHERLIDAAIGGRFASWVTPSNLVIGEVAERLAADVTDDAR